MKQLAIDWDETELRLVAGDVQSGSVRVTHAAIVPLESAESIREALHQVISQHSLAGFDTSIAVGRGKSELRTLQLPPVPEEELPEMVRFQAIRSFASAGEQSVVDFLVTTRSASGIEAIVAAMADQSLSKINQQVNSAALSASRIVLRPCAATALYLEKHSQDPGKNAVLVDLLANDAEIVIVSGGRPVFIRTVRIPVAGPARQRALAGELRRSLVAWGGTGIEKVILWGKESVHQDDQHVLSEACNAPVQSLDPFELVDVAPGLRSDLPDHVGRLAPLVGMLTTGSRGSEFLIDFLNPRRRPEEPPRTLIKAALIALPLVAAGIIAMMVYGKFSALDAKISQLRETTAAMKPGVERAVKSIERTQRVDQFLDGSVQWLDELERMAQQMPASDQMIVRSISASASTRDGGGVLKINGGAVDPEVIKDFEQSLRDEEHQVIGEGASEEKTNDAYRWRFSESIRISGKAVRRSRYRGIQNQQNATLPNQQADEPTPDDSIPDQPTPEVQP